VIVDRSLYAEHGDIVIAALNTEPLCKRLHMRENSVIPEKFPAKKLQKILT
jgi:DNA polymerase V